MSRSRFLLLTFAVALSLTTAGTIVASNMGFKILYPLIATGNVEVHLGARQLARTGGAPATGQFQVVDARRIELVPPADAASGSDLPLRILVNGAESPPRWLRVP